MCTFTPLLYQHHMDYIGHKAVLDVDFNRHIEVNWNNTR